MSKTINKRLSLSLETIKSLESLDEVSGGRHRHKKSVSSPLNPKPTPPVKVHSFNPSCAIICFQK